MSRTRLPGTYLFPQLLVDSSIMLGTELLLEEREEDGDDDSRFYRLTEDDEEDWDREDVRHRAGDALDARGEGGRSGLKRLQIQCSCQAAFERCEN
jgi:hypothetical protein